ncbi:hypothetical protein DB032_19415 [Chromobacterium sp. Panama]|nr:hypothetical protein DB032_19415 [Chromobacterium sp. Panama]
MVLFAIPFKILRSYMRFLADLIISQMCYEQAKKRLVFVFLILSRIKKFPTSAERIGIERKSNTLNGLVVFRGSSRLILG